MKSVIYNVISTPNHSKVKNNTSPILLGFVLLDDGGKRAFSVEPAIFTTSYILCIYERQELFTLSLKKRNFPKHYCLVLVCHQQTVVKIRQQICDPKDRGYFGFRNYANSCNKMDCNHTNSYVATPP